MIKILELQNAENFLKIAISGIAYGNQNYQSINVGCLA
jgi:hypothetical protein